MIRFEQRPDSFLVDEELYYSPSGSGGHCLAQFEKRGISTLKAKDWVAARIGVPFSQIHHAGMKDAAATARQWFSWPIILQQREFSDCESLRMLQWRLHDHALRVGHVRQNHFVIRLQGELDSHHPLLSGTPARFPNFFGGQRFCGTVVDFGSDRRKRGSPMDVSRIQSHLFNLFLRERIDRHGDQLFDDDIWLDPLGKKCFSAAPDDDIGTCFDRGELSPTGPMFGYHAHPALRNDELAFLESQGLSTEWFRRFGKSGRGARRVLWAWAREVRCRIVDGESELAFSLAHGSYATVLLCFLFLPELLARPVVEWPDFSAGVTLC